ncbi:MAG TPA: Obg family GTPase CgtA, partial [Candidatus Polarisedimenticolaceae bacterium]|nr:Obg family GTPase CgtA [Candidatus Polarisedimenticolaceae bacterium]
TPNLGVVDYEEFTFLVADIPGLIEGASKGRGLGDDFLRHIERTAVLVHLIDVYSEDVAADYRTIQNELKSYRVDLSDKPQLVVLTKTEGMPGEELEPKITLLKKATPHIVMAISAAAGQGIRPLLAAMVPLVEHARTVREAEEAVQAVPVIDEASQPNLWQVEFKDEAYHVSGQKMEAFARRTDWENDASVDRLRDILRKNGIDRELRRVGAEPGCKLSIGGHEVEWLG